MFAVLPLPVEMAQNGQRIRQTRSPTPKPSSAAPVSISRPLVPVPPALEAHSPATAPFHWGRHKLNQPMIAAGRRGARPHRRPHLVLHPGQGPGSAYPASRQSISADTTEPVAEPALPPKVETSLVKGKVDELLEKARLAMRERRYSEPAGDNALLYYRSAAATEPGNGEALDGLTRVASVLASRFEEALAAESVSTTPQRRSRNSRVRCRMTRALQTSNCN